MMETKPTTKPNGLLVETLSGLVWVCTHHLHTIELNLVRDEMEHTQYELRIEWNLNGTLASKRYTLSQYGAKQAENYIRQLQPE